MIRRCGVPVYSGMVANIIAVAVTSKNTVVKSLTLSLRTQNQADGVWLCRAHRMYFH